MNLEKYKPIIFMIISALAFSLMNGIVKYLGHVSAVQLIFFRSSGSLILCWFYLASNKIPIRGNNPTLLIYRGIVGTTSLTLFFIALKHMPIGSAVTIRYMSPIFAAILAYLFLKEKVTARQWFFFLLAFVGVAMLKGFDTRISFFGLSLILGSAFFSGLVYFVIAKIGKTEHPLVIVAYFMTIACVFGLLASLSNWYWPTQNEWYMVVGIGILGFFGQLFMTKAIQMDLVSRVIPFKYTEAMFSILVGWVWFGEGFMAMALIGMLLIVISMLGNVLMRN